MNSLGAPPPGRARRSGGIVSRTRSFTFLFTDIEGSTRMLSRLGPDRYATVLADHHRIVRGALAAHGGTERDTQGDAFFATFDSPRACTEASIAMQRSMGRHPWPDGGSVSVRMGIHAGEASEAPTGLIGEDVHRAARIAGVAHGGQVVLSETAAALVRDGLSSGTGLRDLGQHRLKDLGRPHRLFQVVADGLRATFPPLRSLDNPELPNNLPHSMSTFVGRATELAEVHSLVQSYRLVTLAGAGGAGKTRLALEVAARLVEANREGVFYVDLASVGTPDEVPGAVQSALGVPDRPHGPGLDALLEVLQAQQTLIVLDNCEHVVDECARLAELVEKRSKAVHILATSREPFGIDGERVYRLGPLSLPPDDASSLADLAGSEAVELFVERVRAHDGGFAPDDSMATLLASVCRRLDGVPFALELAAARLGSMSLADVHRRLDQRFGLLTSGSRTALPRQRTLQATVDWSYDLLSPTERAVLDRLSVFVGSFDLSAAESVCAPGAAGTASVAGTGSVVGTASVAGTADALASLLDKSLLAPDRSSGDLRYRLLDTIRQYAADRLAGGGERVVTEARALHAAHYLALAEQAAPALRGGPEQGRWMKRLDLESTNLRAAADHFDDGGDAESVVRLCAALSRWFTSRNTDDFLPHLLGALASGADLGDELRAQGLLAASWVLGSGAPSDADMATATELADTGIVTAQAGADAGLLAELLVLRAFYAWARQDADWEARSKAAIAAALESGDSGLIGLSLLHDLPDEATGTRRTTSARRALDCLRDSGDLQALTGMYSGMSHDCLVAGDVDGALEHARDAVRLNDELGGKVDLEGNLAVCALLGGTLDEAERAARSSLIATSRRGGTRSSMNFALWVLACCATRRGEAERAVLLVAAHDALDARLAQIASHSFTWTPLEQRARDDNHRQLRELLGEEDFARLYRQGQAMSLDAAVDLALGRVPATPAS